MQRDIEPFLFSVLLPIYGERESNNIIKYILPSIENLSDPEFNLVVERLSTSEPWQYIVGKEWFYDLEFKVTKETLIPRPETEELVYHILKNHSENHLSLLDIGTGTGCIPIAIKKNRPSWEVSACDISDGALMIAQENSDLHQTKIQLFKEDILHPKPSSQKWDIIVSNPPYIPTREKSLMSKNVLDFEPHQALFVTDEDPLIFYRKIGEFALQHLSPSGFLYFELNEYYAAETKELIGNLGFKEVEIIEDLMEKNRMLKAIKE
ncbi:MAG TPA: peptide chain release factor N(5)-glutamine methyltransferase [Chitinophagales bacterium]|nr:peptide chain release factor N(5)-glutamine methyltransferase [Chitinophagales bacterium]